MRSFVRLPHAALALASFLLLAGCQTELDSGLSGSEANEIVALLLGHNIPASRQAVAKDGTLAVFVERAQFAEAVGLLRAHGLPHERFANTSTVFTGGSLVNSPVQERARLVYALEQELAETISQMDGVLTARVHVVLLENDAMRRDPVAPAASVFIKYDPAVKLEGMIPQIKTLVANSVPGLGYNTVSLVLMPSVRPETRLTESNPTLISLAGIWVDRGSVSTLESIFGGAAILLMALVSALAWNGRVAIMRAWQRISRTPTAR